MAATFSNPRLAALPCERMLGCSFADDFRTLATIATNYGTDTGAGNTANKGLTTTGAGYISYDVVPQPGGFSVVVRFSAAAVTAEGILLGNANLTAGVAADGFTIWVDSTGVRANHSNGVAIPTRCSVDVAYADGELHTVTYIVDMTGGTHSLYVDALAVNSVATTINEEIGATTPMLAAGDGTDNFVGTIRKVRVFDNLLTEAEHDTYHADTVTSYFSTPLAAYRCDAFCDDTDGHYIWDRTTDRNDLAKADRATAAEYPTLGTTPTDHYVFDGVDDYVDELMTLPTLYTITAAKSAAGYATGTAYPTIEQDNDETFTDLLTVTGAYSGFLHSLVIHTGVLNTLQLSHDEYQHLCNLWRGRAARAYMRLITEGTCQLAMFADYINDPFRDFARDDAGTPTLITGGGVGGVLFESATSNITFADEPNLRSDDFTIAFLGDFDVAAATRYLAEKSGNISVVTSATQISVLASTINHVFADDKHLAVVVKSGTKPRFFINGEFLGLGSVPVTPNSAGTSDLIIGNNNALVYPTEYAIQQVCVCDRALTDNEIRALYESATVINEAAILAPFAPFRFTVKTDNAGTSANDEFLLPLKAGETYDCYIDWGDGTGTFQTTDVSPTHTYAAGAGIYEVSITGTFPSIYFANGGDKLKLLQIQQWGDVAWGTMDSAFRGCANMTAPATDTPDLSSVISMFKAFMQCSVFNSNIDNWDVSNIEIFDQAIYLCVLFNQPLNSWNMSKATTTYRMLQQCAAFNQPLDNWNTSQVGNMSYALYGTSFNQSLAPWDVSSTTAMTGILGATTLSTANYDALLIAWNAQVLQSGVSFDGGNATYTQTSVDSGTTDGTTADHLIHSGQNFDVTVAIGDIVHNTTDDTYAAVTNVLAADLTLDADIMVTGEAYVIQSSAAAKARYNMLSSDGWTIVDGGPV